MSLRLRLLIGILVLAAAGMFTLDFVSYRALEDHLLERVDDQARGAALATAPALRTKAGLGGPGFPGGGPGGEGRPGGPDALPSGTFTQLRTSDGRVLASLQFGLRGSDLPRPDLSGDLPSGDFGAPSGVVTVGSRNGSDTEFRVSTVQDRVGLLSVAAVPTTDVNETLDQLLLIEMVVTAAVLIALAGLAWWMIGIGLRPLKRMSETAGEIAAGDLSRRVEDENPKTETGRLGISLNTMLHQIEDSVRRREESEARMRRFLSDASHELRTPLASIRGYAELYRLGAIPSGPEADRAMERIEKESARMGDLVEGLLTLARLDEVPEPVREPVDLAEVASELRDDARAVAPDREFSLEVEGEPEVLGDDGQLRQLLSNLLRNAIGHTPAGTPVEIEVLGKPDTVVIRVRDHGSGINEQNAEQLFERFWREGESRSRETGGAGIGLAVVAAAAAVHGGSATARNATEGGAVFTVELARDPGSGTSQAVPTGV